MKTKLLFLITLFFTTTMAYAYDILTDGIYYNLDTENKTAEVTHGDYTNSYSGSIIIPESISYSGTIYKVTKIGSEAFLQCTSLSSIIIPNSVTEIGGGAFVECTSLSSVTIPKSITYIGNSAFLNTSWLNNQPDGYIYINNSLYCYKGSIPENTHIEVKEGTTQICGGAFEESNITSITIPNSVTEIGDYAFINCRSLTSIKIPDSVTEIKSQAFRGCYNLSSISIGSNVIKIGSEAFFGCSSLTSIAIPNSVTEIGNYAFANCYELIFIKIPNNVTEIKSSTFGSCSALSSVSIGNSVAKIAQDAFNACPKLTKIVVDSNNNNFASIDGVLYSKDMTSLLKCPEGKTSVIIPDGVTAIGKSAFYKCKLLTSIKIPNSVIEIGDAAFQYCSALSSVSIGNSVTKIGASAFYECKSLTSIKIPNSVTEIGKNSFRYCSALSSISIGNKVTKLEDLTFNGCSSLDTIICLNPIPPTASIYLGVDTNTCILFVHKDAYNDYLEHEYWGKFLIISADDINYKNIITKVNNAEWGSVDGEDYYNKGGIATLIATANEGYYFKQWSDGNTDNPRTITVTQDATFTAIFEPNTFNITTTVNNENIGTTTGSGEYLYGTEIELTAIPAEGYHFVKWSDGDTNATRSIVVTSNVTLTAEFAINVYTVTLLAQNGTVIGAGQYEHGKEVSITATPNEGYHFVKWSDGDTNATRSIIVTSNVTLTAEFAINVYTVTLSAQNGTVTGASEYNHGQTANITATPAEGYHFVKWSDGDTNATRSIIVTSNVTLTAEFAINVYTVTLLAQNGTVIGAGQYEHGKEVSITATSNEGYHFVKWSDGDTNATRSIIVTSNVTLTAEFAINVYTVTLLAQNGTVTGAGQYEHGKKVIITAAANEGYHFVKWSDGDVNATRTIKITTDLTLTAEFAINVYTLILTAENGTVTGAGQYEHGKEVIITATANEGYHFVKWSDGNVENPRTIVIIGDMTLAAEFEQNVINTDLEDADVTNIKIYVRDNMLYIEGVEKNYYVFDASGRLVYSGRQSVLSLPRGVYMIAINGKIEKIVL